MITPMTVQDGINAFLEKEVASKHFLKSVDRNGKESMRNPQIIKSGWVLPQSIDEDNSAEENFPYITTRIEKLENVKGTRESVLTMLIIFGVYDPGVYKDDKLVNDGSGYRDVWNLIETTRQAVFINHTIDRKYRVIEDFFEAEMMDEQDYPYWEGYCRVKWHVIFPLPKLDESFYEKGD